MRDELADLAEFLHLRLRDKKSNIERVIVVELDGLRRDGCPNVTRAELLRADESLRQVLGDVAVRRLIVNACVNAYHPNAAAAEHELGLRVLRLLALSFVDHPDFDPEWSGVIDDPDVWLLGGKVHDDGCDDEVG